MFSKKMNYPDYLKLDQLLACQVTESGKGGRAAHEEMLFIIVHQTYELWFKQILHESTLFLKSSADRQLTNHTWD